MISGKKILILSDSVALARDTPETCSFENTWPYLLREKGYMVHQVSIGGATSTDLLNQINYHTGFNPDILILNVGIVDCAPRFMTKTELGIMKRIPFIGNKIIGLMNNNKVRQVRKISYVSIGQFEKNIRAIINYFKGIQILILGIVPATIEYEKLLPGITENINKYNKVLNNYGHFMPIDEIEQDALMSDHHHLNAKGQKYIFEVINNNVMKIMIK
ncbi:MAG: SGNH/GDSL hydrolase family protein [Pyrinomonadaceae bacterium]|nr:SGNH/GDSL hydrolase family protein [Sphingobacteriaceae bacterium]